jgi:hypothetical protein
MANLAPLDERAYTTSVPSTHGEEREETMATVQKTHGTTSLMKTSKPPAAKPAAAAELPTAEQIAARAYEIWEETGCPEGCEQEHWYQAERELLARKAK